MDAADSSAADLSDRNLSFTFFRTLTAPGSERAPLWQLFHIRLRSADELKPVLGQRAPERSGIGVTQLLFRTKIRGVRLLHRCPCIKYRHPVRHLQRLFEIVRDQKHPRALVRQLPEMTHHSAHHIHMQPRCGLVRDDQTGIAHERGRDQDSAVHAAGQLERIQLLHLFFQMIALEDPPELFSRRFVPSPFAYLGADLHERIQKRHALGHQYDLISPQRLLPLFRQRRAVIEQFPARGRIVGKDPQNAVRQQTLSGAAGTDDGDHLPLMDGHVQIADDRKPGLAKAFFILFKRHRKIPDVEDDFLLFHKYRTSFLFSGKRRRKRFPHRISAAGRYAPRQLPAHPADSAARLRSIRHARCPDPEAFSGFPPPRRTASP